MIFAGFALLQIVIVITSLLFAKTKLERALYFFLTSETIVFAATITITLQRC